VIDAAGAGLNQMALKICKKNKKLIVGAVLGGELEHLGPALFFGPAAKLVYHK
jgi:hypothetical protein